MLIVVEAGKSRDKAAAVSASTEVILYCQAVLCMLCSPRREVWILVWVKRQESKSISESPFGNCLKILPPDTITFNMNFGGAIQP